MITDRASLIETIGAYLDRDDLAARAPTFIQLAEARLNRLLQDPEMEVSVTLNGNGADLPADFGEMVSIGTADGHPLAQMANVEYSAVRPTSGSARHYAIRENRVYYVPGSANPTLVYRRRIPPLTQASPTNWLLSLAPDAYLYGALVQASAFLAEDDRTGGWKASFDEAIGELRQDGDRRKWGAGTLAPRIRRA